ncbi:stalk domain-containing protein [Paenibacillus sp. UNC451MF]|uniref:stalk domain-containing protein n=1 Tax=Paenibacillus sp. UNC451MF TaxID=1449063 RepID=UPI00048C230B|nr:stalk domain-containing protein [Paenibacillus sp. UNC451MF]
MKKLIIVSLTSASLLVGLGTGVYAGSNLKEIQAYLNGDLKVRVNGSVAQLNDEQGLAMEPITYNGSTYLPVRGVANALKVAVDYDAVNNEVILGEKVNGTPLNAEKYDNVRYSKEPGQTTYKGKNYQEVLYQHSDNEPLAPSLFITPDKKYQKLNLKLAAIDKDITQLEIKDLDSNALLKKVDTISINDGLKDIEVDIGGVKTIVINFHIKEGGGYMVPLIDSYYK